MALHFKFYKDNREFLNEEAEYRNPNKGKWYARAVHGGTIDLQGLAEKVAYATTLTPADAFAAVKAFVSAMTDELQAGQVVKLDSFGSFKLTLSCVGADSLDEFSVAKNITGVHVNFQPAFTRDPGTGKKNVAMTRGVKVRETPKNAVV